MLGSLYVNNKSQSARKAVNRLTEGASQSHVLDSAEFPGQTVEFKELKSLALGHVKRKGSILI